MSYQKQAFMTYLHDKGYGQPGTYCNGLDNVEKYFTVNIDTEFEKDQCEALYDRIQQTRKNPELIGKNEHTVRQYASNVRRYIEFRVWQNSESHEASNPVVDKIGYIISEYKKNFDEINKGERYKWEAIGWYKRHWNIEAPDFASMITAAFSKAGNLLASGMYYPYRMLTGYAQSDPEAVRSLFRMLYDESVPLAARYVQFQKGFENYLTELDNEKARQHYQDLRAVMVYLTFEYPEKYYLFKSRMFSAFKDRVGYTEELPKTKSVVWKVESFTRLCDIILEEVRADSELVQMHLERLDESCYEDPAFHLLAMDIMYYGSAYMSEKDFSQKPMEQSNDKCWTDYEEIDSLIDDEPEEAGAVTDVGLNTILYGPPGTGKTYHTAIYAVAIIENRELAAVAQEEYADVLKRYNGYKAQGRIEFTTFHQSYGYEEFIEGIRPAIIDEGDESDSSNIQYSVQPGVFKKFCEKAEWPAMVQSSTGNLGINENATIWKVSLWSTGDNEVRTECLKNGHIRIGWDQYGKDITDETDFSVDGGRVVLNAFINKMQIGDIVLSCYSASTIDAIGVVTGEYEWHDEYRELKRLRKVNWIAKNIRENILEMNGGTAMTLASVYRLSNIAISDVYKLIEKHQSAHLVPSNRRENYVFIIDEINRGNISKIFGELITLIEATKRVGLPEGMKAVLPYSQKQFGVPKNVYIIGTMNTADRSIATIDTALRRRFFFKEMMPKPDVLAGVSVEDLSVSDMLLRMNKRIAVLYDREHTIGHAYFMPLKDNPTIETLAEIFTNNIIPLLQEYFYEDYEKIRLVLGDNRKKDEEYQFIIARENDYSNLFGDVDVGLDDGQNYEINYSAFAEIEAYRSI